MRNTRVDALRRRLAEGRVILGDGALGTLLQTQGRGVDVVPEALALSDPDLLEQVARAYVDAGAEIVQTNTFGASPLRLAVAGLDGEAERINRRAVAAARRAAEATGAWVTASVGPSGRTLEPFGDLPLGELEASFRRQVAALVAEGVDAIGVETMMDVEEACAAVRAAREIARRIVVTASLVFQATPTGWATPFGTPLGEAVERLRSSGADVVGTNCGTGTVEAVGMAAALREATDAPLIVRPNAGLPETTAEGATTWPESPAVFAEAARRLREAGVTWLGGCCGTTPDHVRAMREALAAPDAGP
jgi:5-methyltetrahydrofolate--homocysteine methyltransferase